MTLNLRLPVLAACLGGLALGPAFATAQAGGVVGTGFAAGFGSCNRSQAVPLDTPQDRFDLDLAASCDGGTASASGRLRADAATGAVGLQVGASGAATVSAEVRLYDTWQLTAAPGTLPGTYTLPVTFTLEGQVSPGAVARLGGHFLGYSFSLRDFHAGLLPSTQFGVAGNVDATGAVQRSFAGTVDFRYFGPGSARPPTAEVEIVLLAPQLEHGLLDFYNTAAAGLRLPAGWSAASSSGLALPFTTLPAVPEPATWALWLAGLGGLAVRRRPRR